MRTALAALAVALLVACATRDNGAHARDFIMVSGVVKLTGSEGDLMLILVTDEQRYEIVGDLENEIVKLQQRRITVRGRIVEETQAPGFPPRLLVIAIDNETS